MNYTVRDEQDEIWGTFATESEALEYGSHLANAHPDKFFGVYGVTPIPQPERTIRGTITPSA